MLQILEVLSTPYLIIVSFENTFKVIKVGSAYLKATNTKKKDLIERGFIETLAKDPINIKFINHLSDSLHEVITTLKSNKTEILQYTTGNNKKNKQTRSFQIENTPVLKSDGTIEYIVHTLLNVTDVVAFNNQLAAVNEENEKVKKLLNKAEVISKMGTWELDLLTNKITWSDGVYLICGYEPQSFEVTFERGLGVIHPDDRERAIHEMQETIKTGKEYKIEKRFLLDNGEVRNIISRASLIKNEQGIPLKLFGVFQDITDEKLQHEELVLTKKNQESLINSTQDLIWSIDTHFCLITANHAWLNAMKSIYQIDMKEGDSVLLKESGDDVIDKWINYYKRTLGGETFTVKEQINYRINGKMQYSLISFTPMYNENGELFGVACYSKDITEETQNLIQLENTKAELKKIMDSSLDMICTIDEKGIFLNVSAACEKILGYRAEELVGKSFVGLVSADDSEKTKEAGVAIMSGVDMTNFENHYVKKDGSLVPLVWSARWDSNEKLIFAIARDATEKKQAEHLLKVEEKRFRALAENGADAIVILTPEGKANYVSPSITSVLGYTEEEALQLDMYEIVHPDDRALVKERMQICLENPGIPIHAYPARTKHKDGTWRWLEATITNMLDDDNINGIVDNFRDVTLKKEQELEVTLLMDNTEESFILLNKDLRIVSFNKQFLHLYKNYFGLDVKKGDSILNYASPERIAILNDIYQRVLNGEQEESEITVTLPNNLQKIFNIIYKPALNDFNEIIGVFVSAADITEKKIALDELKNSEEKYKQVFFNSPLPKWICDCETNKIIEVNEMALSHYGYTKEEFLSMTMNDFGDGGNILIDAKEQKGTIQFGIINHTKKDKTIIKVELTCNKLNYENKDCILVVCNDVTAREDALKKLHDNEIKLLNAQKIAKLGYWQIQLDRKNLYWSNEVYNIWGVDRNTFDLNYNSFFETIYEDDKDLLREEHAAFFNGVKEHDFEHRIVLPDGSVKWVHEKGNVFTDKEGKALLYEGTVQDITVEKLLSISLQESNQRYVYATKATFDAIWDWDFVSNTIFWGDGFNIIFGYNLKDTKTDSSSWIEKIHPDDYNKIVDSFRKAIDGSESNWLAEFRFKRSDGTYAFIVNRGFIIRDRFGKAIRMVGAIQDITKQKKEEERLKLLESVITNTNDSVLITEAEPFDLPGPRIIYVNEAFTKMTGYTAEEVIGKTPRILQGPKTDKLELKRLKEALHKWESCEVTTINYKKSGEEFWINFTVTPVANEKGWFTHWIAIERDITASKLAEQSLQASYYERNTILESIYDAFFAIDKSGTVIYWNNKAERFLGKIKEEILGKNLWEVFKDAEESIFFKNYRKAIAENETKHFEAQSDVLGGWFEVSAYPSANGLSVYFKDITERKNTEIKLLELHDDLEKHAKELYISNQELEQFAYVASHDLQEPLRMVTSFLTQLEKKYNDIIDDKGKQYIHFAVDGAKRMRQIILDLLEFSKLGKMEDKVELVDVNELLKEILSLFYKKIEDKQAVIHVGEMPQLVSFISPLRQVFQNIIGNSLKYHKVGISPEIHISAEEHSTYWEFTVADNGIGIDPLYFDKIFIIFQRLHHKQEYSGTGMGLAITKKIIENLGGKIWVESEEGKGSTFHFTIIKN